MPLPVQGTIGIVPDGSLGVSLFYHLTRQLEQIDGSVFFLERRGSGSVANLRSRGELCIADARQIHRVPMATLFKEDLLSVFEKGYAPEIVLACPNPDQLLGIISEMVSLLESAFKRGELDPLPLPI